MPMAVGQAIHSLWVYGDLMCKLSNYLQGVAVTSGVFTITAMSLDRYMAIRHPMSRKIINRPRARKIILLIWFLSLAVFSPILFIRKTQGFRFAWDVDSREFLYCVESWPDNMSQRSFGIFCFVVVYAIPGCIVVVAYSLMGLRLCSRHLLPEYQLTHIPSTGGSNGTTGNNNNGPDTSQNSSWQVSSAGGRLIRERRRVAKILLVLALVFAFCWLPYSVLSLFLDLSSKADEGKDGPTGEDDTDEKLVNIATSLIPFTLLLGHVNSAVNPLLYCLLSKNFRRSVTDLIRHPTRALRSRQQFKIRMTFRRDPHPSADQQSTDNKPPVCRPRNHHAPEPPPPPLPTASNSNGSRGEPQEICLQEITRNNGNHHHHHHFSGNSQNGVHAVVSYSPSSSGYSSIRCSADNINIGSGVHCHSSQFPYFNTATGGVPSSTPSYGNGYSGNSCDCSTASVACCHCGNKLSGMGSNGCPLTIMSSVSASLVSSPTGCCSYHSCHHVHGNPNVCPNHCCVAFQGKKGVAAIDCRKVHVPSTIREESESYQSQRSKSNASGKSYPA
ncbi:unnamed protein product [Orchesella dallaii]